MLLQLRSRWVQTSVLTVVGVAVGAVVSFLIFAGGAAGTSGGQLFFATGGSSAAGPGSPGQAGKGGLETASVGLPGTAAQALADRWKEAPMCAAGLGRYFQQEGRDETDSYLLMYNRDDQLIGVYLYSMAEMPAPWQRTDQLQGNGGMALLDFEHWGLFVYAQDPIGACAEASQSGS